MATVIANAAIHPGNSVSPQSIPWMGSVPWLGVVQRVEGGKALVEVNEIRIGESLMRRIIPPVLAWVDLSWLIQA